MLSEEKEIDLKLESDEENSLQTTKLRKKDNILLLVKIEYDHEPKYNIYTLDNDFIILKKRDQTVRDLVYKKLQDYFDIDKNRIKNIYNATKNQNVNTNNLIVYFLNEFEYQILNEKHDLKIVTLDFVIEKFNFSYENTKKIFENIVKITNEINNQYFQNIYSNLKRKHDQLFEIIDCIYDSIKRDFEYDYPNSVIYPRFNYSLNKRDIPFLLWMIQLHQLKMEYLFCLNYN